MSLRRAKVSPMSSAGAGAGHVLRLIVITSLCATRTQTKDRYIAVNVRRPSLLLCISSTQFNIAFKPHSFAHSQASLHRPILPQQPQTGECHFSAPPLEHRQPPTCHREFLSTPLFLPTLPWKIAPTTTATTAVNNRKHERQYHHHLLNATPRTDP
jgi:hypothetical protein